jgi:hypothetical protein
MRALTALGDVAGVTAVNVGFSLLPELDWVWSLLVGGVLAPRDLASAPIDTSVFLRLADLWNWPLFTIGVGSKILAGALISLALRRGGRAGRQAQAGSPASCSATAKASTLSSSA